ncbi:MAG: AraC family transcriptional regulator [Chlamydiae bacterium]|nr:AraC family transcriptional regulator [Chlamydiota bacterium]
MDQAEEYARRVLKVMIYIEENLDEELTLEKLAKVACYSPFHFHRIFQAIAGETVHDYVKRLRMQAAAAKLRYTERSVTEIALDASFETPSAFTKAFKQFIGSSPKSYRSLYAALDIMTQKIKELLMIKPEIIEKSLPDMPLLFIRRCGNYTQSFSSAWQAMNGFINVNRLDRLKLRYFGISHDDPQVTSEDKLRCDAAILAPIGVTGKGEVGSQVLKGGKYAIFTHNGPYEGLEDAFNRIFLKWLPESRENFDETRSVFCEYFNMEYVKTDPEKLITKLYIPLN